ncbi:carbohydrate-binding family 9-like protein [Paraflavitalea sp. CAU 1676]|uniref:carbohydrate-binding family 9-like protein n=1 Tax=Paraflavitalea sp. CAU 1676 TaxID=3032598 RepID=UPI0023D9AC1E|nr:carbohydrate-binding family 9-like protein [Paraflavitalea sp. CAU 1676]MDF2193428.1 carbohydrate-binding family 9-like protein [Paraflavitalea sp. CAU 1676]
MKKLTINKLSLNNTQDIKAAGVALDALVKQPVAEAPWMASYPYKPTVHFAMGHQADRLFLKYYVTEKAIRAVANQVNGKVWEDSCVEFFIAFDNNAYYNLEFNCIGTALIGFGPSKHERNMLPAPVVEQVAIHTSINRQPAAGTIHWELTIIIPLSIFLHHQPLTLSGKDCRANFYKCGDLLPDPHFVAWSGIDSSTPNFHVPASFGSLHFE